MPTRVQITDDEVKEPEAPITSPLALLKSRREQLVKKLFIDLRVPRWDEPEIYVRFSPLNPTYFTDRLQFRENQKPQAKDWMILAQADALINSCVGVYAALDGDMENKYSLRPGNFDGAWTQFDTDLAKALGLPDSAKAVNVVRELYLTDGDLIDAASRLIQWSNQKNEEVDEDF